MVWGNILWGALNAGIETEVVCKKTIRQELSTPEFETLITENSLED